MYKSVTASTQHESTCVIRTTQHMSIPSTTTSLLHRSLYVYPTTTYPKLRPGYQGRGVSSPVMLTPEAPEHDTMDTGMREQHAESVLVGIGSLMFVGFLDVQLGHPDGKSGLG